MIRISDKQREVLFRMTDGRWYLGRDLTHAPQILAALLSKDLVRYAGDGDGYLNDKWTITPEGGAAVGVVV